MFIYIIFGLVKSLILGVIPLMDMSRQFGKHNHQLHSKIYLFSSGGETIDAILVIRFMLRDLPAAVYDFCLGVN